MGQCCSYTWRSSSVKRLVSIKRVLKEALSHIRGLKILFFFSLRFFVALWRRDTFQGSFDTCLQKLQQLWRVRPRLSYGTYTRRDSLCVFSLFISLLCWVLDTEQRPAVCLCLQGGLIRGMEGACSSKLTRWCKRVDVLLDLRQPSVSLVSLLLSVMIQLLVPSTVETVL